tara:strand:+ start:923 stop:1984 length:1062 start_codon:yes stop_codon:yes gene_type:complete
MNTKQFFLQKHKGKENYSLVEEFINSVYSNKKSINFSYDQAIKKALKWQASKKMDRGIKIKKLSDGFSLFFLNSKKSLINESIEMNNCLGCIEEENPYIYSIRNDKGKSVVNFEVIDGEIIEFLSKSNSRVKPKYLKYLNEIILDLELSVCLFAAHKAGYVNNLPDFIIKDFNIISHKIGDMDFIFLDDNFSKKGLKYISRRKFILLFSYDPFNNYIDEILNKSNPVIKMYYLPYLIKASIYAIEEDSYKNLTSLSSTLKDVFLKNSYSSISLLFKCVNSGSTECLKFLLDSGFNFKEEDFNGIIGDPFISAIENNDLKTFKVLLKEYNNFITKTHIKAINEPIFFEALDSYI